jgi:hypothetical protein
MRPIQVNDRLTVMTQHLFDRYGDLTWKLPNVLFKCKQIRLILTLHYKYRPASKQCIKAINVANMR